MEIKIDTQKFALPSNGRIGQDHLAKIGSLGTNLTGELGREEAGEELSRRGGSAAGLGTAARLGSGG